jgi:hypothetical protein
MISQAAARSAAWTRVFEVVPSASAPFRMSPRLNDEEQIVLGRRDWALLAATGASTSIDDIAQKLKIFEFAAAKKVAELTQRGLIEFINTEISQTTLAASELLSGVVEARTAQTDIEVVHEPLAEIPIEVEPEDLASDDGPPANMDAEDEAATDPEGPTWVLVENEDDGNVDDANVDDDVVDDDDDDPVPLLEELHRLHEAQAADREAADRQAADRQAAEPDPQPDDELSGEDGDEEFDMDDIDGGDLATRWKNLRKAKRGVHASNE